MPLLSSAASGSQGIAKMPSKTFDFHLPRWASKRVCGPLQAISTIRTRFPPLLFSTASECFMEFLSAPWWSALLAIVLIDLVLAGDNAIVIALAARSLPQHLQKKAILWGTVGAIAVRSVMTVGVVWLLKIPGLMLVGGLGLLWIAYKLLADQGSEDGHDGPAVTTFWGAMKTILVADALMGVDNVLGVAGAAHGAFDLVIIGLLVSVPIVVLGSTVVLKLVERFPAIIQIGAAVLAFTAAKMIVGEPVLASVFGPDAPWSTVAHWGLYAVAIAGVLATGSWAARRKVSMSA
jgi:YjbE family integral membrane protein